MSEFKIACIGNMNNNNFSLVRFLRDRGYNAHLFFLNEIDHFHPQNDTFDIEYQSFSTYLDWRQEKISEVSKELIKQQLDGFSFVIAEGIGMAFLKKGEINVDIFIPYGSDLYLLPFWTPPKGVKAYLFQLFKRKILGKDALTNKVEFTRLQIESIKSSGAIICGNKELETPISKLSVNNKWEKVSAPIVYNRLFNPNTIEQYYNSSHWLRLLKGLLKNSDFVIMSHVRQYWVSKGNESIDHYSLKANDRLIRAFSRLVNKYSSKRFKAIFLEYGPDVYHSKALIEKLGISSNVIWLPKSSRKELMVCMSLADLVAGEFNLSSLGSGVAYEAMAMAKPLLGYREDSNYSNEFDKLYPLLNATTEDQIYNRLEWAINNSESLKNIGLEASEWYQEYVVDRCMEFITSQIEEKKKKILNS